MRLQFGRFTSEGEIPMDIHYVMKIPHNYSYHVTEISRCGDLACFFLVSLFSAECVTVITKYHLWIILDHYSPVSELDREDGRALF